MEKTARNWPVNFDPNMVLPGTTRILSKYERAAIWIYLEKSSELSTASKGTRTSANRTSQQYPKPKDFEGIFRRRVHTVLREMGELDDIPRGSERKEFINTIAANLFRNYMVDAEGSDLRDSKPIVEIIRRITGLGNTYYTDNDLEVCIRALDEELQNDPAYIPGTLKRADVDQANAKGWIVSELGIPLPNSTTFVERLKKVTGKETRWIDVLEKFFDTDVEVERRRREGFTLDDLEQDYILFTVQLREEHNDPAYLAQTADFEKRSATDRFAIRIDEYMVILRENTLTLDDLRELVGEQRLKRPQGKLPRAQNIAWSQAGTLDSDLIREKVIDAYLTLWAQTYGVTISGDEDIIGLITKYPPPRKQDSVEHNAQYTSDSRNPDTLQDAITSQNPLIDYFGGMNQLLAAIEERFDVHVCLSNPHQRTSLAAVARGQNIPVANLPHAVRELVIDR